MVMHSQLKPVFVKRASHPVERVGLHVQFVGRIGLGSEGQNIGSSGDVARFADLDAHEDVSAQKVRIDFQGRLLFGHGGLTVAERPQFHSLEEQLVCLPPKVARQTMEDHVTAACSRMPLVSPYHRCSAASARCGSISDNCTSPKYPPAEAVGSIDVACATS